ncbi:hypothetical protein D3C78_866360 [compost metagenome]
MAEQRHAGHRTEEHAHQHRHEGQQNAPAPEGQQQQQQNPHGGTATDPGHLPGGLLLPAGCVQQAAGGEQLHVVLRSLFAAVLEQVGHLQRQVHVEGVAGGARAQQHPAFAIGIGDQGAAADVQLHRTALRLAVLDTPGQAQPVILARHQAVTVERVEQGLHPLLDKGLGVLDQQLSVHCREHRQATLQQLRAQRRQVGLQGPLDLFEQAAGLPLLAECLRHGDGLLAIAVADQHQHFAVQRFLHALFGAQFQGIGRCAGHQIHQVGRQRRAVTPLPTGERQYCQQQDQKQPWQPPFTRQSHAAPRRSTVGRWCCPACATTYCRPGSRAVRCCAPVLRR